MYDFLIYSLKTAACLAVFYLFYKLVLSRETFHRANRVVLLAAMAASFALPLCIITVYREAPAPVSAPTPVPAPAPVGAAGAYDAETVLRMIEAGIIDAQQLPSDAGSAVAGSSAEKISAPGWRAVAAGVYIAGAGIALLLVALAILRIMGVIRTGEKEPLGRRAVLVRKSEEIIPFSWIKYIVVSNRDLAENGAQIISHEKAHIELRHSLDLMLADLFCCLQWFNPAVWLLRRELTAIHEYEADRAVLASGADPKEYQMLLIKKAVGAGRYSIANSLNHSKLKNRITMMLQKKSNPGAKAKILLLLPVVCLALTAFAQTEYMPVEDKVTQKNEKTTVSAPVVPDTAVFVPDVKRWPDNNEIQLSNAVVFLGGGNELFVESGILKYDESREKADKQTDTVKTRTLEVIEYRGSATVKKNAQGEKQVMFVIKPPSDLPAEKKQENVMRTYRFILDDLPEEFFEVKSFNMDVDALKVDKELIKIVMESLEAIKIPGLDDKGLNGGERLEPNGELPKLLDSARVLLLSARGNADGLRAEAERLRRNINIDGIDFDASQWEKLADSLGVRVKAYNFDGEGFDWGEGLGFGEEALSKLRDSSRVRMEIIRMDAAGFRDEAERLRDAADRAYATAYSYKAGDGDFGIENFGTFKSDTVIMMLNGKPVDLAFGGSAGDDGDVRVIKRGESRTVVKTIRRNNLETMRIDIDGRGRIKVEGRSTDADKLADAVAEIAAGAGKTVRDYEYSITASPKTRVGAVNGVKEQLRGMGVEVKIIDPVQ